MKKDNISYGNILKKINNSLHYPRNFPTYPLETDDPERFHVNIYNYLLLISKNFNNNNYPTYINESDNIESKKRGFRKKANKYTIDSDWFLCYKKLIKNKIDDVDESENLNDNEIKNINVFKCLENNSSLTKLDLNWNIISNIDVFKYLENNDTLI